MSSSGSTKGMQLNSDGTASILLDPVTVNVLVRGALEDAIDARDARRTTARIKAGREKVIDSVEVYRRNGL